MLTKAYSLLNVKGLDEERRVITGMATTPSTDRVGDVVEPLGVTAAKTIPLFLYHDSTKTVGTVQLGRPTKAGVPFTATLPRIDEPGVLKDRVDEAWGMVKHGLIAAVSIGFRALEDGIERIKGGGLRFLKSEVLELSLVPVPANAEALIHTVKSAEAGAERAAADLIHRIKAFDTAAPAATGQTGADGDALVSRPGDSGKAIAAQRGATQTQSRKPIMKTIKEQIEALEATRAAEDARCTNVMQKALAEGRPTDDDEAAEFDEAEANVKRIDEDLARLRRMEALNAARAKAVDGTSAAAGTGSRGPTIVMRSADAPEKFEGQNFVRQIIAKAAARLEDTSATRVAIDRWGKSNPTLVNLIKAGEVPGGGTGAGEWGAELATVDTRYRGDFIDFLYKSTLFDQFAFTNVPENIEIKGQDGEAIGYWVGESKAIPATKADFFNVTLTAVEVAALAVISNKLIRTSSPDAELLVRNALVKACASRVDATFFSAAAAVPGVSPAGILAGVTPFTASGTDAAALRADVESLYAPFIAAENSEGLEFVIAPGQAKALQLMTNALGQAEFPGMGAREGRELVGDPLRVGGHVPSGYVILIKPSDIYRIGDAGVQVAVSREATIEQSTAPTGATDIPVAQSQATTSMFQSNSTAIRVVRPLAWAKRRASAVSYLTGAAYRSA